MDIQRKTELFNRIFLPLVKHKNDAQGFFLFFAVSLELWVH